MLKSFLQFSKPPAPLVWEGLKPIVGTHLHNGIYPFPIQIMSWFLITLLFFEVNDMVMIFLWWLSLYVTYRSWLLNFVSLPYSPLFTYFLYILPLPLPLLWTHSLLPFIFHPPIYIICLDTSPGDVCQLQLSHVATPVVPYMAAPQAMASTTTMWCASPATKATLLKGPPPLSARPAASGAGSHRHAEVNSSHRAPAD